VDVSAYVLDEQGIQISRGRSSSLDDFRTGVASFSLLNTDRRFDPLNASGPYFGNLLPGKQVRIRATANSVTVDQFRGFIKGWPQSFAEGGKLARVDVECYDGLGWLSEARTSPGDLVLPYARDTIGSLQMFLRTLTGDREYLDVTGNYQSYRGVVYLPGIKPQPSATTSMSVGMQSDAINFDPTQGVENAAGWSRISGAWSLSLWFRTESVGPEIINWVDATDTYTSSLSVLSGNQIVFSSVEGAFTIGGRVSTNNAVDVTAPTHVVVTCSGSADPIMYVNGVAASVTYTVDYGARVGRVCGVRSVGYTDAVTVQDVAAWNVQLSAAQVLELYQRSAANRSDTTTVRAGAILDDVGWPSAWRDLTTEPRGSCFNYPFSGTQASNLLTEVERTEQGRLFVAKDGDITLLHRYWTTEETRGNTIQATFSDDGADIPYSTGGYDQAVDDVLNDVTVATAAGAQSNGSNSTSITNYGRKSETINTLLPTSELALNMAQGVVVQRKDVTTRLGTVQAAISQTDANWQTLCGLEIGDRVRLEMTPSGTGSQFQQSAIVEGIQVDAHVSWTAFMFEAAPLPAAAWFTCDSSLLDGAHVVAF
jgi:hypothetical protein